MYEQRSRAKPAFSVASRQRIENGLLAAMEAPYGSLVRLQTSSPRPQGIAPKVQAPPAQRRPPFSCAAA
jgi:hypothetical protein